MISIIQNILIASLIVNVNIFHSIHISYGEATLTDNEFHGKVTFYKDDFLLALKNWKGSSLNNLSNKDFDELKFSYLQNHFAASINGYDRLLLKITGNNENANSIWFTFEFISDKKIESLELKYDILINEFSDQMNLLNISSPSGDKSFIFNESKPKLKIKV